MAFEPLSDDSSKGRQEEDHSGWWANNKTITVFALRPTSVLIDYLNSKCQLQVLSFCSSSGGRGLDREEKGYKYNNGTGYQNCTRLPGKVQRKMEAKGGMTGCLR